MYLFTEIKYDLDSTNIEKLSSPGQITSLFGYLSQPDDFSTSAGLTYCWNEDVTTHASSAEFAASAGAPATGYTPTRTPEYNVGFAARKGLLISSNPIGHFSCKIPLSHIFGFAEYKKFIYGQKHTLTLTRGVKLKLYIEQTECQTLRLILLAFHGTCHKYNYLQNSQRECDLSL